MSSLPPNSPYGGLPTTPRPGQQMLSPLNTSLPVDRSATPSPMSSTCNEKQSPQTFNDTRIRNRDSMIFVNATIPLSPATSLSREHSNESPLTGLAPRKRNGFARLFCCFGREERARRRAMWAMEYEEVGKKDHWTDY